MKRRLEIRNVAWLLLVTLFYACQKEEVESPLVQAGKAIRFQMEQMEESDHSRTVSSNVCTYRNTMVMRSATSADTLAVDVYGHDGVQNPLLSRGAALSANNLTSFAVYASSTRNNVANTYIKDWKITRDVSTGDCTSNIAYHWPGDKYTLQFMALAPYHPQGLTINQGTSEALPASFTYVLPDEAVNQTDIAIATTAEYAGDYYLDVPLTFKHLCAAINVKVGSIPKGTVQSVKFKNIPNKGTYTIANEQWAINGGTKKDYAVDFVGVNPSYTTTGTETGNPQMNEVNATFMMIPQTLSADAELEIVFVHNNTGKEEILTASLTGEVWTKGQTHNYLISITPDYILDFAVEEIPLQDAHYVMVPLSIKANYLPEGWTISAKNNEDSKITFRAEQTTLQKSGYWIEEDRGDTLITVTTLGDAVPVYAYLEENIGTSARDIELVLRPKSEVYKNKPSLTLKFSQLCPNWNTDLGSERIDDGSYPWGFSWDSSTQITYTFESDGFGGWLYLLYINWQVGQLDKDYVTKTSSWGSLKSVTVDFSKVQTTNVAKDEANGHDNTKSLYNFKGVSDVSDFMSQLESWGGTPDKTLPANPADFAARACVMKNKFNKEIQTNNGVSSDVAVLKDANFVWYLPAKNEITQISDTQYPMNGTYWTSTSAPTGETQAYKYSGGNTSLDSRSKSYKVRAIRVKP